MNEKPTKPLAQSLIEILIILKRNIFHVLYFALTGLIIGFIYSTWVMDTNYKSQGKIELRISSLTQANLERLTLEMQSTNVMDLVVAELIELDYTTLPNGKEMTPSFIASGLEIAYTVNSPTISVDFNSPYQSFTSITLETYLDVFVEYGNTSPTISFANGFLAVSQDATTAVSTNMNSLTLYLISLVLGVLIGSGVVVSTDYLSGKILFASDLELLGYRTYSLTSTKKIRGDITSKEERVEKNIINLQNNLESNIFDRFIKTIAYAPYRHNSKSEDLLEQIAKMYAGHGYKTIIVDLDLSRPHLDDKYAIKGNNNIVDFDPNTHTFDQYSKVQDNLYILPSKEVLYPAKFFKSEEFEASISKIKDEFDIVLFRLAAISDDTTSINALDQFDFLVVNVFLNHTSKKKLVVYLEKIKQLKYENIVINTFE